MAGGTSRGAGPGVVPDESIKNFLAHWGIKGMKWGVRRDVGPDGRVKEDAPGKSNKVLDLQSSKDHRDASHVRSKAKVSGVSTLSNKDLQTIITRMNLEQQFAGLKRVEHEQSYVGKGKKWAANFVTDVLKDGAASWIKRPGSNFSGRTSGRARAWVGPQPVIEGTVIRRAIEG